MKKEPMAGRADECILSFTRKSLRPHHLLVVFSVMFCMVLFLPCAGKDRVVSCANGIENPLLYDGSEIFNDFDCSVEVRKIFPGYFELKNVCSCSSSVCFSSTLIGLGEISDGLHSGTKNYVKDSDGSCKGLPFIDTCDLNPNGFSEEIDLVFSRSSSPPHLHISPPFLDWGMNSLYTPSLVYLTVVNTHNSSYLDVFEPFCSDQQFYAYGFEKLSLAPGQAGSIGFVFLPRWLGSISAHIVLQSSFGGFIVQAKGIGVESPHRVEPFVGFEMNSNGRLSGNLSLYNPFDDLLYVDEVSVRISVSSKNTRHSGNVICSIEASHQPSGKFGSFLNSGEICLSWIDIRPYKNWEVPLLHAETIIKMNLWPPIKGNVSGVICVELWNSTRVKSDTIILRLEAEVDGRATYNSLTSSVSVFFETLVPWDGNGLVYTLSLRNSASDVLSVVSITESSKFFKVKYMEGLFLFPGTVPQVALISYNPSVGSGDIPPKIPGVSLNCKLYALTNDSVSPQIEIPCQDLVSACCRHEVGSGFVMPKGSLKSHKEKEKLTNSRTGSLESIIEETLPLKSKVLGLLGADELIPRNCRSQGTMSKMSVLKDHELLFPVVQIGTQFSKWITVHNPSQKPVIMQLVLNSGAIIDQCKFDDDSSKHSFFSGFLHIDSVETQEGFSIPESATTQAFVHPFENALFGPVLFHPSKRCAWRSSALIRNNLSGLEWLPLRAFGGSHSLLLLKGSKPVKKLEFSLPLPMTLNLSSPYSLLHLETGSGPCGYQLFKELYAKNTGELPLDVIKLEVSGTDCGLDGFMIHTCNGFSLAPGESVRLLISYQAYFSAAVVRRDLKLAMATGVLVIPMRASLPVNMLDLCKNSLFRTVMWKLSALIFVAASIVYLVFFIRLHPNSPSTEGCFVQGESTTATISRAEKPSHTHCSTRNARSIKKDKKPVEGFVIRYTSHRNGVQKNTQRMKEKTDLDQQQKAVLLPPPSATMPDILEATQSGNLTVGVVERGRRRKRRASGGGLTSKFDVSSSQSGNSTPPSALSPNAFTPNSSSSSFTGVSEEQNHEKKPEFGVLTEARVPELDISITCRGSSTARPILLPSATFPGSGWRAAGAATSNFLASTSPIAPHARAPGSKLGKEMTIEREEDDAFGKQFTYDIWGNHFSDHLMGKPKGLSSKVFDASEGDFQSFFARDPQSLMMMSSAQSVTPGHKLPSNDVDYLHQMD